MKYKYKLHIKQYRMQRTFFSRNYNVVMYMFVCTFRKSVQQENLSPIGHMLQNAKGAIYILNCAFYTSNIDKLAAITFESCFKLNSYKVHLSLPWAPLLMLLLPLITKVVTRFWSFWVVSSKGRAHINVHILHGIHVM